MTLSFTLTACVARLLLPQSIQCNIGSTTSRHTFNGWMAAFEARWTWLSNLVVRGCVVGERGQLQRTTPMGIRCVGLDSFNLSCCAGCGERRRAIPGRATVMPSRSVRVLIVCARSGQAVTVSGGRRARRAYTSLKYRANLAMCEERDM